MSISATLLTTALVATVGNAATVMDTALPFSVYEQGTACMGEPMGSGTIASVTAMNEFGTFCENVVEPTAEGDEVTVFTKVVFTSCDAMELGYVFVDAFACTDSVCGDCQAVPVPAEMIMPKYNPLPAADTCWGIQSTATEVTVLNRFDRGSNAAAVAAYWEVYTDNSCIKDTVVIVSDDSQKSISAGASASTAFAAAATLLVAALI